MPLLDGDRKQIPDPNRWHVISNKGGWVVRRTHARRATKQFESKKAAVEYARSLARKFAGEVIIHRTDGRIESQQTASEKGGPVLEVYSFGQGRASSGI